MLKCLTVTLVVAGLIWAQATGPRLLSVCAVLGDLPSYRGHRVTVRGELISGEHGSALVGDGCKPLVTTGYRWPMPTPIGLTNPESPLVEDRKATALPPRIERLDPERRKAAGPGAKV